MNKLSNISQIGFLFLMLFGLNLLSNTIYKRFDLTEDHRFTLTAPTLKILDDIEEKITIKIYLKGDFPSDFKRLQSETKQLLEEFKAENSKIRFKFLDPLDNDPESLIKLGLQPSQLSTQQNGRISEIVIFPWAVVQNGERIETVSLLKDSNAQTQEEQLQNAIQNLEYAFADAIHKVSSQKKKKIAILKGNGMLDDIYLVDFLRKLGEYYHIAPFTLDSVQRNPQKTTEQLANFDLVIIAKPSERFTEKEKYTLDQFTMKGGKSIWLLDEVHAEIDSLMATGKSLAYPRDLNLTDLLFNYGVRINPVLVKDLYSATIPIATGNIGNKTQFNQFLWSFYPVVQSNNNHVINKHIEPVFFRFANSIDLLKNDIIKTVLLQSSTLSKTIGTPNIIDLKSIAQERNPNDFKNGNQPLAVLLEGEFKSAYSDRIKPFNLKSAQNKSANNKMIIIADGDLIANQISKGIPTNLGVDKYTGQFYGNKEFLLNCVNYLLDDSGLIQIRSKTTKTRMLDREKSFKNRAFYQLLNTALPLLLLALFGIIFNLVRRRKYQ
ncbi:MAG: gliding motility-associated ABC transporter substrate-binding protein GldG [Flavobacteriaceae bacterium]|nr:gliding motility-associated ABC transporter substrate-binding protein GldG [Flavobacteriaceae bacterium]